MGRHMLSGTPRVAVEIRRSDRARRLTLRVSRLDGRVTLTLPRRVPDSEGLAFVRDREDWVRRQLATVGAELRPRFGAALPFEGASLVLIPGPVRGSVLQDGTLILPDDPDRLVPRVAAFLKTAARDRLTAAADRHSRALGRPYRRITLRDTRSRWGSCSAAGDLMFNWRLVMAPPDVLDYVAAHEVAHLAEMNHSPAFWAVVERLFPDHRTQRRWLREQGQELHRLRLDD